MSNELNELSRKVLGDHVKHASDDIYRNASKSGKEQAITEKEIATKKTITYVDANGVQHTRKAPMKKHNQETPQVIESEEVRSEKGRTMISAGLLFGRAMKIAKAAGSVKKGKVMVTPEHKAQARKEIEDETGMNEDFDYDAHDSIVRTSESPKTQSKFRLKNRKTGGTVGIFNSHKEALSAHKDHPQKHNLYVESTDMSQQEVLANAIATRKQLEENQEVSDVMSFKLHRFIDYIYEASLDEMLEESTDAIRKQIADLNKSPFTQGKARELAKKHGIDLNPNDEVSGQSAGLTQHKGTYGSEEHKSGQDKADAKAGIEKPKKSVGRPVGSYTGKNGDGKYNIKNRVAGTVGKNVHAGRAANMQKEVEGAGLNWKDIVSAHKEIKGKGDAPVTYGSLFSAVAHHLGKK